tara:strand:- start:4738 stop:7326 length:2589 start_codon:yes stop_codon:yes gene_type:complete
MELLNNNKITWENIIYGFNNKSKNILEDDCDINITEKSITNLIKNASLVDYLDTNETNGILLAHSSDKIEDYLKKGITHCEIHPSLIFGLMANQIIFPENNPYPRDAFSCGQSKQAVSLYNSNYHTRFDKSCFILNYGQIPLTKSRYLKYATKEQHPYGENAIVAIMCYSGYNVEDAVIINEASLKRGLFRTTYYNTYQTFEELEKMGNLTVEKKFMNVLDNNVIGLKAGYDYLSLDTKYGIIKENTIVNENSVIIGMATNSITSQDTFVDNSVYAKKGQVGIVDKAFITEGQEGKRIAKVRIRAERIPQIGDKFCSRAGQKGTIGIILPECDMPCTEDGIRPDIIVNPHAMPSRMTIGHLIETLTSKTACLYGNFGECTAFTNKGPKHKQYGEMLIEQGYHSSGNQILYNGMTGEQLETEIYFGPTYYLRLKHMPKDKINYRARGPRTVLTRQTVQGRANNGGLRIGEMDRDCLIAHGLSQFVKESMMVRGDQFRLAVCNKTGCIAIYNKASNIFLSPMADGPIKFIGNLNENLNLINVSKYGRDFSIVEVPYAFKLLMQELQAMNIQMRIITDDNVDQLLSLTEGDDIQKLTHNKFFNLEQISNLTKGRINKYVSENYIPLVKEKTPELEARFEPSGWGEEYDQPEIPENKLINQSQGIDGTEYLPQKELIKDIYDDQDNKISFEEVKPKYIFNDEDIVVFKNDDKKNKYKIVGFDDEELKYITEAIEGENKGLNRDALDEDLELIEKFSPKTPDYDPDTPNPVNSDKQQKEIDAFNEFKKKYDEKETEETEEMKEIDKIEKVLGNANEEKEEESEKILKTVSSLNEEKTEGINLLLPEKDENEGKKDEDEISEDKKQIV